MFLVVIWIIYTTYINQQATFCDSDLQENIILKLNIVIFVKLYNLITAEIPFIKSQVTLLWI